MNTLFLMLIMSSGTRSAVFTVSADVAAHIRYHGTSIVYSSPDPISQPDPVIIDGTITF